ncbi:MAG: hypothetical protein A3C58_00595 [Candidatus Staskawiczbacteria bacterium RIFCSPHIGHO2_02_FULL_34_10]|uniref:Uncharacterized protein n=2 Tax=Candidatus Staskawicziibacteriota TaxID=1817916 RepID=A0A1G2HMC6_9BACT|nr:MAG: hypothetical protein A2639_00840 [Candidatus Staskawiczbacteria bacterium RIFCSPHIGHO2_01_FULL_34_27]OGZ67466.1 MAG: hypothetical protein A3C58_00595 [Candidatus Staskawiczbacteria bacterium RIFCSPHIGHO2_02_FULL_34_10]
MIVLLVKIFVIAFFINLLYEVLHSVLYKTCLESNLQKYIRLILKAAIFDGFVITIIYYIEYIIFKNQNLFYSSSQIITFSLISLFFAYIWEIYSLKKKKWEYSNKMPLILGVGITPFLQLCMTGILSIYLSLNF